jgi:hypothetical protein
MEQPGAEESEVSPSGLLSPGILSPSAGWAGPGPYYRRTALGRLTVRGGISMAILYQSVTNHSA